MYRSWAALLPSVDVIPVHLPGREGRFREPAFRHIRPLIDALTPALIPYLDRPYALFGHSMGAIIGLELARQLRRQGKRGPVHLFVSGHRAPHLPDPDPPTRFMSDDEFRAELQRLQGTPQDVLDHPELMELMLPLLRADFELSETYEVEVDAPLECPISVFGGIDDPKGGKEELDEWRQYTTSQFTLRMYPGNHFYLAEHEREVIQAISQDLALFLGHATGGNPR
jgi:surfactin synthase thioesterase subunit